VVRVLIVLNSLGAGGTERSTAVMLPNLRRLGFEPIMACFVHRDEGDEEWVRDQGFDVRIVPGSSLPTRIRGLRELIRELRPALVHTAIFEADLAGRLAAVGTGVPVLSSLVNTPYVSARFTDPRITPWKLRGVQLVDAITAGLCTTHFHAVTDGVKIDASRALGVSGRRITVVERGRDPLTLGAPDPSRRTEARKEVGIRPDTPVVLAVGRVEYQKGHMHLIEAAKLLRSSFPDLVVLIAGREGNASRNVWAAISRTSMGDRVRLLGHRTDVGDLLAASDVFALPSLYEGTAGAALEAFAVGTPVVASRLVGTEGLLIDGVNARVVEPADPPALARAIADVLSDRDGKTSAMVAAAKEHFARRFDLERSVEGMAALYRSVAASRARPPFDVGRRAA
jgi:glycosyltransferase involved in cell wall biosynthesis